MTYIPSNKGQSYIRIEMSPKQKELIGVLAELEGSTSQDLLNRVVERFIDSNLGLIDDYRNGLDDLKQNARRRLTMKIQGENKMANELTQKQITSPVAARIGEMQNEGLMIAQNYSVSNALSSAYYALKNSSSGNLLQQCTQDSIYNALLDMVTQGLSPAKTQCYFIPYGNTVKLTRSYFGTMKVVKQLPEVKDIYAEVIYEGDKFQIKNENGRKVFVSHETDWVNADNPIAGAYCIIEKEDGEKILTVMTKKEIDKSWAQAKTKNVQNNFPQEMAKRTVINRAAKQFFNTSDDNDLFIDAVNRTTENEYDNERQVKEAEPVREEVETLDDILKAPSTPTEVDNVLDGEFTEETKTPPKTAEKTAIPDELASTEYPADEIPDFNEETGEVLEEISLFEGNTTNIKEQQPWKN